MTREVVFAHAGGAPEALTIGLPILIFVGFMLAEKRARKRDADRDEDSDDPRPRDPGAPP